MRMSTLGKKGVRRTTTRSKLQTHRNLRSDHVLFSFSILRYAIRTHTLEGHQESAMFLPIWESILQQALLTLGPLVCHTVCAHDQGKRD